MPASSAMFLWVDLRWVRLRLWRLAAGACRGRWFARHAAAQAAALPGRCPAAAARLPPGCVR
jgi:hypothetical protein